MSIFLRVYFGNFNLYRNKIISFCNLVCVYIHKICEKFGCCKKSFLWLGQKVNKKIDAQGHDANDSSSDLHSWSWDGATVQLRYLNII